MRLSTDKKDRAYSPKATMAGVRVYLASLDVTKDCITADEELGEVVLFMRDANGNMLQDPETGRMLRRTLSGVVKIVVPYELAVELTP